MVTKAKLFMGQVIYTQVYDILLFDYSQLSNQVISSSLQKKKRVINNSSPYVVNNLLSLYGNHLSSDS